MFIDIIFRREAVVEADTVPKLIPIKSSKLSSAVEVTVCTVDTHSTVLEPDHQPGPEVSLSSSVNNNNNYYTGFIEDHGPSGFQTCFTLNPPKILFFLLTLS